MGLDVGRLWPTRARIGASQEERRPQAKAHGERDEEFPRDLYANERSGARRRPRSERDKELNRLDSALGK